MLRSALLAFCMCVCVRTEESVSLLQSKRLTIDMNRGGPSACTNDTPENMRHASSIWARQAMGVGHGRGRLDSPQGWSSQNNKIGEWYQMDNGVVGAITGVAMKGRKDTDQWVKTFKAQSKGASACTPGDTPETMRHASSIWAREAIGVGHGRGRLNSPQGWSSQNNKIGEWYQMDNGVVGEIAGVAIKGRKDNDQRVQTFKVQWKGASACTPGNTPETKRHASSIWARQAIGVGHGRGRLDSPQGWSSQNNKIGEWYQMDNGVVGEIAGVAIKGRKDHDQRVQTFKVQSKGVTGKWTDVDSGKVYTGNTDRDSQVDVIFDNPVDAQYIRIYPQTWHRHMSLRADILAKCVTGSKWTDVDSGKIYTGNTDRDTRVDVIFDNPVNAQYIRIYPQTWNRHMSLRADILAKCVTGSKWTDVDSGKIYTANSDRDTRVDVIFDNPVDAQYIRIYPQTWHRHMSMRADIMANCGSEAAGARTAATVNITTCDTLHAQSNGGFYIQFDGDNQKHKLDTKLSDFKLRAQTSTFTVMHNVRANVQKFTVSTDQSDGLCTTSIVVNGQQALGQGSIWIDKPCTSYHYDGTSCHASYTFDLTPAVSPLPDYDLNEGNACKVGYNFIRTKDDCINAAKVVKWKGQLGVFMAKERVVSNRPTGCYMQTNAKQAFSYRRVIYNTHENGAANAQAMIICKKHVEPPKAPTTITTIKELEDSYTCDGSRTAEMEVFSAYWEYNSCGHFGNDYNAKLFCGGIQTKGCPDEIRGDPNKDGIIQLDPIALKKYPQMATLKCKRATKVHFFKSEAFASNRIYANGKHNTKQAITLKKCNPQCFYLWHAQYKCVEFAKV